MTRPDLLPQTVSQTAGPYVHIGLAPDVAGLRGFAPLGTDIAGPHAKGTRIRVEGRIYDGEGALVKDAMIEVWQANAAGIYAHPGDPGYAGVEVGFRGWGRVAWSLETGLWSLETVRPGVVAAQGSAPHLSLWIVARGINSGLHTRMYFPDCAVENAADPLLAALPGDRRQTLIADQDDHEGGTQYRFDIVLQGDAETVFLDV